MERGTSGISPVGKRSRRSVNSAGIPRNKFYLHDRNSGRQYLVDTGATDSVFPATEEDRKRHGKSDQSLGAANCSPIRAYGHRDIMLNFGDGHRFTQRFIVCDVAQPMLGFDFFKDNKLKIDVDELKLEYKEDGRTICSVAPAEFHDIMARFPTLFEQNFSSSTNKHLSLIHI